jgi:uncharacterized membrane protein YidH (DUF202 family)
LAELQIGHILALMGMVVLILGGLGRQRARKLGKHQDPDFLKQQRWLYAAAYGLILGGLMLMWGKR